MLELIKSIFIGIVQGITEWLPVSSTGHMILFNEFVHLQVTDAFFEMFHTCRSCPVFYQAEPVLPDKITGNALEDLDALA